MPIDMLERLRLDPGTRTIGQLIQEREWSLREIERLRTNSSALEAVRAQAKSNLEKMRADEPQQRQPKPATATRAAVSSEKLLLRLREVCQLVGLSRSTIYLKMSRHEFPTNIAVGVRGRRWRSSDILAWQAKLGDSW
jgi:prophage regulatory protein